MIAHRDAQVPRSPRLRAAAHAACSAAVVFASCWGPITSAVGIPSAAAKTASCGPSARAWRSEDSESTAIEEPGPGYSRGLQADGRQLAQRLAQSPRIGGFRYVTAEKLRPVRGLGWMPDANRRQDGDPDGVGDLVAIPQPPVIAAERERDDGSDQRAAQRRTARRHRTGDARSEVPVAVVAGRKSCAGTWPTGLPPS